MSALPQRRVTVEEYLSLERQNQDRHEYLDGEIFAMGGASWNHGLLVGNVFASLHAQLQGGSCFVQTSDLRVRIPATDLFTYPDVVVVCGEPQFDDSELDTLLNPTLIVEVLSKSTEDYDRGRKFAHYRTVDSLAEYVLLAQDKVHAERFTRQAKNRWQLWETDSRDECLALAAVECELKLREIYRLVLPEHAPANR